MYDKDILGNSVCFDAKKECLVHMCKIVNCTNSIENNQIRKGILEKVTRTCQLLR